jgi:cytochrome P450
MPTVLLETFGTPSPGQLAALSLLQYVPMGLIRWILNSAPVGGRLDHVRNTNSVSQRILLELIEDRKRMMKEGGGGKRDIMSHILRAGLNEDPTAKLSDDEIVAELRYVLTSFDHLPSLDRTRNPHYRYPLPQLYPSPLCLHFSE